MRSISTLNCQKLLVLCFKFILTSCELTLSQMSVSILKPREIHHFNQSNSVCH